MKRIILFIVILTGYGFVMSSCIDNFLDRKPLDIISDDNAWNSDNAILASLARMYDQVQVEPHGWNTASEGYFTQYTDESMRCYSWGAPYTPTFPDTYLAQWEYSKVRTINEFIDHITASQLTQASKNRYLAEAYFLRAFNYFVMAKRYGGVPLIKEVQKLEGVSIQDLKVSRNTEEGTWNFIAEDCDRAIAGLPETNPASEQFRATKYAAYALKSRAMLYAGSISRYGNVQINGLVGIPADKANTYFNLSLEASNAIISSGKFQLYDKDADKASNYQKLFLDKTMHEEAIYVKAFNTPDKGHRFDYYNAPLSFRVDYGSNINPTLELVEAYEYVDGSDGALKFNDAAGNPVYYDQPDDIFKDKDPRFFATILYPNCPWQGGTVEIRRGIIGSDGAKVFASSVAERYSEDPAYTVGLKDGIVIAGDFTRTGFYIKKYMDPINRVQNNQSNTNFLIFRYGETLLNYAEAAMELNRPDDALPKLNAVRERAGIQVKSSVTLDDVRRERRVELAFENLRYWDLTRWRIATQVMNNTQFSALIPWLDFSTKKYVFERTPNMFNLAKTFLDKNYYQPIPGVAQNELLIQNPGF